MSDETSKSVDILGIKPIGDAVKSVVDGSIAGVSAFLGRICLPAAEEFGLLLQDKVSAWRTANLIKLVQKAQAKLESRLDDGVCANPRLVAKVVDDGSWASDEAIQEMWAGLLASSCTPGGQDDSNLLFMNLLNQLTVSEARLVNYACSGAEKYVTAAGWVVPGELRAPVEELRTAMGVDDYHRIDRELDHLRALQLLGEDSGFGEKSTVADISPTALALQLFARCHGHGGSPIDFFNPKQFVPPDPPRRVVLRTKTADAPSPDESNG